MNVQSPEVQKTMEALSVLLKAGDLKGIGEDLVATFQTLVTAYRAFKADTEAERAAREKEFAKALTDLRGSIGARLSELRGEDGKNGLPGATGPQGERGERGINGVNGKDGKNGRDGNDGSPDMAEDVRNKLELLSGEDRLKIEAILGLREALDALERATSTFGGGGANNFVGGTALSNLVDVDLAGILAGQSIKWDGVRFIPYTPAGGGNTSVYEEAPTDSGDQTNFTLAHTPVASTLRLYRGGARLQYGIDYTLAAATITLVNILISGEILLADYEH